ncbi:hypothetical protein IJ750_04425 [bacterium]|nr:hypothetical protein [bacterium]MBR2273237.1 hypothetical protein [Alphaproteobacteria bacterium]
MKKILIVSALILIPMIAKASCYDIKDNDAKNNCLAMQDKSTHYCYNIKDNDKKNYCLAKVGSSKHYCYSIKDSNMKNECLALVK